MAMPHASTGWTAEKVRTLPDDGNRYEVVDGELLVTPAPSWRHQEAVGRLYALLLSYLREHPVAAILLAPAEVAYEPGVLVQPDLFIAPLVQGRRPATWQEVGRLLVAIEVLSPATARADRGVKRRLYQRQQVPEYWIVDVDARLVERWRPHDERGELLAEELLWRPDRSEPGRSLAAARDDRPEQHPLVPPLRLELPRLFAEVWGEE